MTSWRASSSVGRTNLMVVSADGDTCAPASCSSRGRATPGSCRRRDPRFAGRATGGSIRSALPRFDGRGIAQSSHDEAGRVRVVAGFACGVEHLDRETQGSRRPAVVAAQVDRERLLAGVLDAEVLEQHVFRRGNTPSGPVQSRLSASIGTGVSSPRRCLHGAAPPTRSNRPAVRIIGSDVEHEPTPISIKSKGRCAISMTASESVIFVWRLAELSGQTSLDVERRIVYRTQAVCKGKCQCQWSPALSVRPPSGSRRLGIKPGTARNGSQISTSLPHTCRCG